MSAAAGPIHVLGDDRDGRVRAFLLEVERPAPGLVLIDALGDAEGAGVRGRMAEINLRRAREGRPDLALTDIVLTHAHRSHVQGAARLRAETGAIVHIHEREADILAGERANDRTTFWPLPPYRVLKLQVGMNAIYHLDELGIRPSFLFPVRCVADATFREGDSIGPLQVIHAPGHSEGSSALLWPERRALFVGDVVTTWPVVEPGWPGLTVGYEQNLESLRRLRVEAGALDYLGVGHGDPAPDPDAAERTVSRALDPAARRRPSRRVRVLAYRRADERGG
jgi:glyoxylase-like metal-dependent hydrolase (beta-lactamase superfamily II)